MEEHSINDVMEGGFTNKDVETLSFTSVATQTDDTGMLTTTIQQTRSCRTIDKRRLKEPFDDLQSFESHDVSGISCYVIAYLLAWSHLSHNQG